MKILKLQGWHLLALVILLIALYLYIGLDQNFLSGDFWNLQVSSWFYLALLSPIVHQIYVVVCWRCELYYKGISGIFGKNGFRLYKIGFTILILSRLVLIIILALATIKTLNIDTLNAYIITGILLLPAVYLFYSVKKYFGLDRAFGIDHFKPEEAKNIPFVKKGIFKYTSNGMYIYGFLILWVPGILLQSEPALIIALFNHIYIWIHYYFTELP